MTTNVAMRLDQHNKLQNRSTKAFVPWVLLFHESYCTRKEARKREKYLKSGIGREYVKNKLISLNKMAQ